MDNRYLDIVGEGRESLRRALEIAYVGVAGSKATHYRVQRFAERATYYLRTIDPAKAATPSNVHQHPELVAHHATELVPVGVGGSLTLILYWSGPDDVTVKDLPFPVDATQAVEFVDGWLKSADYGREPDHDGDNDRGWRVFTRAWGRVDHHFSSFVGIQPAWAMYGK